MKVSLMFLVVLMLLVSGLALAEEVLMVNELGEVKLVKKPEQLRPLNEAERMAMENPGQEVPVNFSIDSYKRIDFWHVVPIKEYTEVLVFKNNKLQAISKIGVIEGQPEVAYYIIFCLVVIGLMLISNMFMAICKNISDETAVAAAVAAAATATVAFVVATTTAFAATATAAVVAAVAAAAVAFVILTNDNVKAYWIFSSIFYILMGLALFI